MPLYQTFSFSKLVPFCFRGMYCQPCSRWYYFFKVDNDVMRWVFLWHTSKRCSTHWLSSHPCSSTYLLFQGKDEYSDDWRKEISGFSFLHTKENLPGACALSKSLVKDWMWFESRRHSIPKIENTAKLQKKKNVKKSLRTCDVEGKSCLHEK